MNTITASFRKTYVHSLLALLIIISTAGGSFAQCATSGAPSFSSGCSVEWFVSMSASGTGVVSTISLAGGGCTGTGATSYYFNDYATQGVTVAAGNTVNLAITRYTTSYTGYISVYVDWNNDGTYATSELAGAMVTLPSTSLTTTYSFTVPTTGIVAGTHLHMRVFLSEQSTGAPCTGNYGQAYDYYLNATCPAGTITFSPAHDTICSGGNGLLTASGAGTGGSYTWSPATGLSAATGATVTATPTVTTIYSVTGTSGIGCVYTGSVPVVVVPGGGPVDTISTNDTTRFCPGDSAWLHGSIGAGYTYQWYNGSTVVPGATDSIYEATTSGNYMLQITIPSGCSSVSTPIAITVFNPIPVVTFDGKVFRTGKYYASYQWYRDSVAITGAAYDSSIAHSDGHYTVKVTDTNGCTGISTVYNLANLAVTNISNGAGILIYPNPASNIIHIESAEKVNAVITSIEGKIVAQQTEPQNMDVSALPAGIYFIELFDEAGHRLIVQKIIKN